MLAIGDLWAPILIKVNFYKLKCYIRAIHIQVFTPDFFILIKCISNTYSQNENLKLKQFLAPTFWTSPPLTAGTLGELGDATLVLEEVAITKCW
jgi:hypothetical protein